MTIWVDVTYGNNRFVAVASNCGSGYVMVWSLTYGNWLFVALSGENVYYASPDKEFWTLRPRSNGGNGYSAVRFGNGLFVAVCERLRRGRRTLRRDEPRRHKLDKSRRIRSEGLF